MFQGHREGRMSMRVACALAIIAVSATVVSLPPERRATAAGESIVPLTPSRLLETRVGAGLRTADGKFEGVGRLGAGTTLELDVAGRGGVPGDVSAVLLNVTAVDALAAGFLTVWACDLRRPVPASNVNYEAGGISPNAVLAEVGGGGRVCIYAMSATDVVVDVNGYVPVDGALVPVAPARLYETRSGSEYRTVDRAFEGVGRIPAGGTVEIPVAGRGKVPSTAVGALINVTAVDAAAAGFLTVYQCGIQRPVPASHVNYRPGGAHPNAVLTKIGSGGRVCIYSMVETDVVVDVNGYLEFASTLSTSVPLRMLETRIGETEKTFDGKFEAGGRLGAGEILEVQIAGRGSVPVGASMVVMNLTAVGASTAGYLTAFACDRERPDPASNVNYFPGGAYPNAVVARLSADGRVCIYSMAETDVIIDVVGSVGSSGTGVDLSTIRLASGARQPLQKIPVSGIDLGDDFSAFTVQMSVGGIRYGSLPVWTDESGPYVVAPFHPVHPRTRGKIELVPADGDRLGEARSIDLVPLPAAPGTWADAIASITSSLAARAAAEGSSLAVIRAASFSSLEPRLAFIKMLDQWVDDGTSGDLQSLYAGTRSISADERALVDAIAARLDLAGLAAAASSVADGGGISSGVVAGSLASTSTSIAPGRLIESAAGCRESPVQIDTAEELMDAIELGVEAKGETQGAQRAALEQLSNFLSAAQYVPGTVGDIADLIASFITVSYAFDLIDYYENPTELTSLTPIGTSTFNEDFQSHGDLANVYVTAVSVGGSLEEAFAAAMTELASIALGALLPSTDGPVTEFAVRVITNIGKEALKDRLDDPRDAVPVCPDSWTVDIGDPDLIEVRSALGRLDLDPSGDVVEFWPNQLADDVLVVTARPERFSHRSATGQLPVTVKPIQILLTPDPVFIAGPTTSFELRAQVLNADDPSLEWSTPDDTFATTGFDETVTIQYSSGSAPSFPHVISVRSTSTSGLRTAGAPARTGSTTVNVGGIRILPDDPQLQVGEQIDFDVVDLEDQPVADADLQWDADGGTIDANGVFTAGSQDGTYQVTAVLRADPSKVAVVDVTISDECTVGSWGLQVQRYLDDLYAYELAEFGESNLGDHQGGFERLTITPDVPDDDVFYPAFQLESSLTIAWDIDGSSVVLETRGIDSGLADPDFAAGTEMRFILDDETSGIERRTIVDGESWPWAAGNPFGPAGSVFPVLYICGAEEMAIGGGDSLYPVPSYWTRQ